MKTCWNTHICEFLPWWLLSCTTSQWWNDQSGTSTNTWCRAWTWRISSNTIFMGSLDWMSDFLRRNDLNWDSLHLPAYGTHWRRRRCLNSPCSALCTERRFSSDMEPSSLHCCPCTFYLIWRECLACIHLSVSGSALLALQGTSQLLSAAGLPSPFSSHPRILDPKGRNSPGSLTSTTSSRTWSGRREQGKFVRS